MKELLNFLKDLTSYLIILVGVAGIFLIFWYFLNEYQSRQHAHDREVQAIQIEHEKSLAAEEMVREMKSDRKSILGIAIQKMIDIGQKIIGL